MIAASGVMAALLVLPNLGKGLELAAHIINTPTVAYAAKEVADTVQNDFQDYLQEQRAYTKALNDYTEQLQQQQVQQSAPQSNIKEWQDREGTWWCCNPAVSDCQVNQNWTWCE